MSCQRSTMQRIFSLCLVLVFVLSFWVPIRAKATSNLIADPSFDNPVTALTGDGTALSKGGWTTVSWAFGINEAVNAHTGSNLAHLVYATDGLGAGEFPCIYQDVDVQPDSIYRLTFYAKYWNVNAVGQPLYYGYRNALQDVWTPVEQYSVADLGGEYRQITLEFNTKALTTIRIFAFTTSTAGGFGGYHLDDFSLEFVRTEHAEENGGLLTDGSFNSAMTVMTDANASSTGKWTSMSWASANQEPANAYAGSGLAHLVCATDGLPAGEFPTIYQDVAVQPNSIYKLTFYAKHWNAGAVANPLYYGYRNALQDVWTPVEQYEVSDLTNEYRQITLEFDTKELTAIRIFAFTQSVSGGFGGYHLDNFKLEYIKAAELPETDDPNNMLVNGGFIRDMTVMTDGNLPSIGSWTTMSWASTIYEEANAHTGKSLANLVYAADGLPAGEFPTIYQDVAVQPNSIYRLTFYGKNWNIGAAAQPLYYGYRNGSTDVWTPVEQYEVSDLTGEYRQITLEFDTKELTTIRIFAFTTSAAGGVGGYHLDDFYLEYVGAAEPPAPEETDDPDNMLVNGSFIRDMTPMTDGNASSIGNWTSMSWASTIYEKDNAQLGGSLANLVSSADGLPAGEFPTIYQDVKVKPNSLYTVTFYAKHWSVGGEKTPLYYGFRNALKDVWVPVAQYETEKIGPDYEKITFTINTGSLTQIRIFAFTTSVVSGGVSGYHLDNFTMQYEGAFTNYKSTPVSQDVDTQNLVYDTSFEKGDSQPVPQDPREFASVWTMMSVAGIDGGYQFARSEKSNLFMAYSAEGMPAGDYPTVWQDIRVEKDTWYEMSFYVKQWGVNAADDALYYGFRDPNAGDIWSNAQEFKKTDFSPKYTRVTCRFNTGDRDVIRLFFCIIGLDYSAVGGAGGYHIDNVQLHRLSDVTGAAFTISGKAIAGQRIAYTPKANYANGNKNVPISAGNGVTVTFESKDSAIVTADLQGNLVAAGAGSTQVRMKVSVNGSTAWSDWQTVTVSENADTYISRVDTVTDSVLTTGQYAPLTYQIHCSDGTELVAGSCIITVQSSDTDVVWVKQVNDGYVLYGVGQGTAQICVTVENEKSIAVSVLEITISDGNFLRDSSFELQSQAAPFWKITGTAAYGVDDSTTNQLSRTGYANLWMAAPISWSDSVLPGSDVLVTQQTYLEPGNYTLSAFINRFYATGTEGILSELGGRVELGVSGTGGEQMTAYDVTYGVGQYQQLNTYITISEAGQYQVFIRVIGDEQFGLGMQLEDVTLRFTEYPDTVSAALSQPLTVGGMAQLTVTAHYADGTAVEITGDFTVEVENTAIVELAGRNLLGIAPGQTQVTVTVEIAGKTYTAVCDVSITGEAASVPHGEQPQSDSLWYVYVLIAVAVIAAGAAVFFVIQKKKDRK